MTESVVRHHSEWLSLIEVSGPFLTVPVLQRALPQGLEPVEPGLAAEVRRAHDEWREDPDLHGTWIRWVLSSLLGFEGKTLLEGPAVPPSLTHTAAEHGETLRPDFAVYEPIENGKVSPRLLVAVWPEDVRLDERLGVRRWSAPPLDRMTDLLRATGVLLGLTTNGERWTLVHAPIGGPTALASWDADLWLEERSTLDAFVTFLSARRFFGVPDADTLEGLLDESASAEQEVTDQLGRQVRQAVELLVDAFGRADRDHDRTLLVGIEPQEIYLAAVTVMMRLVFLLSAEERGLFLLGDPIYDSSYAVSTLRAQLQEEADRFGEEPLERRSSAWCRILGTFRMVYAGVEHENLRLPAYGGSLFDSDRFPFLEGRTPEHPWREDPGRPLAVDDRTVLHVLDAIQILRFRIGRGVIEARRLSFRALDVEQIGHVYEGLLDHSAVQVTDPVIGLDGKLEPEIVLAEIESRAEEDRGALVAWLAEVTGRTAKAVEKALGAPLEHYRTAQLLAACDNDQSLAERVTPFHGLLREDLRGLPQVYVAGSVYVTKAGERRSSGTYYTPRSLAEEMVEHALAPVIYHPGPAEDANPKDWRLRPPAELLELKVCDMAMGSGAFLVAATRYLSERLVEAWAAAGPQPVTIHGEPAPSPLEAIPKDPDDQLILARRLVADRCIYGVDKNQMAVEMAKLSMWLVTLAKDRPFSFLDHALKPGDSLLGINDLAQIEHLHLNPARGQELHTTLEEPWHAWQSAMKEAIERRRELESFTVLTVREAAIKEGLFRKAEEALRDLKVAGDVVVGAALSTANEEQDRLDAKLMTAANEVAAALDSGRKESDRRVRLENLRSDAIYWLNEGKPPVQPDRCAFHWPLEFPEVFVDRGGFDAIVGNPPFQGGQKITGTLGTDYRSYLVEHIAGGRRGSADLVAYFFLRATGLIRSGGMVAMLATNTIAQGDTREVGLDQVTARGVSIPRAWKSRPWPGDASLEIGQVWLHRGPWQGKFILNGGEVHGIGSSLDPETRIVGKPHVLVANAALSFQGSNILGLGFTLPPDEARALIDKDSRYADVLSPFLNGQDLTTSPTHAPSRWVINFRDWSLEKAAEYRDLLEIVEEKVKPERATNKDRRRREIWWQFTRPTLDLYAAIEGLDRAVAIALTSKTVMPVFVPTGLVYSHAVGVFAYEDDAHLGILSSSLHWWWALTYASTLENRIRYTPTDCFETFPQPEPTDEIARLGRILDERRRGMMIDRDEGLTRIYNRVHDPAENAADVSELRELHIDLDHAVADAYGWDDIELSRDFNDTPQGLRYTVAPETRVELLDRLLELNHSRFHQEEDAGLHAKKKAANRK
jgi:hypothetical protein